MALVSCTESSMRELPLPGIRKKNPRGNQLLDIIVQHMPYYSRFGVGKHTD